jgi:hypothetical protein
MISKIEKRDEDTPSSNVTMCLHLAIAIVCIPLYLYTPVGMGLAISPYLLFLLYQQRSCFLPALFVHTFYGSQQRYLMLFFCFVYALLHLKDLIQKKLLPIYLLALVPLPIMLWNAYQRFEYFGGGLGSGGTFEGLGYYFGLFAFFYGALAYDYIRRQDMMAIYYVSIMLWIVNFIYNRYSNISLASGNPDLPFFTRYSDFSMPLLLCFGVSCLLSKKTLLIAVMAFAIPIVSIVLGGTFTVTGVTLIAVLLVLLRFSKRKRLLKIITSILAFILSLCIVFWIMKNYDSYSKQTGNEAYGDLEIKDVNSLIIKLQRKAFDDRSVLWRATWNQICEEKRVLIPSVTRPVVRHYDPETGLSMDINLQAHNLLMEMVSSFAWIAGGAIYLTFVLMILKCGLFLRMGPAGSQYYPFAATAFATGLMGSSSGQYPLTVNLSFVLLTTAGICYRQYHEMNTKV